MSTVEHRYLTINNIRMHCAVAGDGQLVLLLHGFPEFWYSWRHQIAALAPHVFVAAPDQRGYNETDRPGWGYSIDVLVADVLELIAALGYERATLVGHDWGGAVAWATAITAPHRIERLAILNTPHPAVFMKHLRNNPRQMRRSSYMGFFVLPFLPELALRANDYALIERVLQPADPHNPNFDRGAIAHFKDAISKPGALTATLNWYRAAARQGGGGLFSGTGMRVKMPTLLIWGEKDPFLGVEMAADAGAYCDNLTIERIPGVGHWVQQEAPDRVSRLLRQFIQTPVSTIRP
ncbi:MAG: alpha/beta hydrolase [Oscillochloris sp.]|nr:alpha/beta hydrolase [Oscillochloris sp.]